MIRGGGLHPPTPSWVPLVLETVQALFTAPVAEPTVVSFTVPLFFYFRCHCNWCDLVLFVGRLLAQWPLGAASVSASRCRVVVVLLLVVFTDSIWDSVMPMTGNFLFISSIKLSSGMYAC